MIRSGLRENRGYPWIAGDEKGEEKLQSFQGFERRLLICDGSEQSYALYHYLWLQWGKLDLFRKNASLLVEA